MRGLRLDPVEVTSERQVVVEEIAMYEDDPWDALELQAHAAFYDGHPYARSVLGSAETLANVGPDEEPFDLEAQEWAATVRLDAECPDHAHAFTVEG